MKSESIKSYWINKNEDDTYYVEIETNSHTINYPRVRVLFCCGENIAFPIVIKVFDDADNELDEFSLARKEDA